MIFGLPAGLVVPVVPGNTNVPSSVYKSSAGAGHFVQSGSAVEIALPVNG